MKKTIILFLLYSVICSCSNNDNLSFEEEIIKEKHCYLIVNYEGTPILIKNTYLKSIFDTTYIEIYTEYKYFLNAVLSKNIEVELNNYHISKEVFQINKAILKEYQNRGLNFIIEEYMILNELNEYSLNRLGVNDSFSLSYIMFNNHYIIFLNDYTGEYSYKKIITSN